MATKADGNEGSGANIGDEEGILGIGELEDREGDSEGTGDGGMGMSDGEGEGDGAGDDDAGDGTIAREGASICEGTGANPGNGAR